MILMMIAQTRRPRLSVNAALNLANRKRLKMNRTLPWVNQARRNELNFNRVKYKTFSIISID